MSLWPPPRSARHSGRRRRTLLAAAAAVVAVVLVGGVAAWLLLRPSAGADDGTGVPESFAGSWSGEMAQTDESGAHVVDWGATVKLTAGSEHGSAEWFTLNCRGSLTLTERAEDRLSFDYVETYDPDQRCIDEVELILEPGVRAGTLQARWEAVSHDGTPMTSTGTLR
ncbi:hypothetical protein DEF23_07535 [Marinitenerispora sediminis]|uniref:Uncharacterized protein n=2 Tax=Marinitenerispora sediminis TaxID=1931232 RepID=A0A368T301_9ACTN|nr:hypothetical protein DEF28_04645 [Marinitenerispora sediminis]RCV56563.1 hypothetical protein DEF24_16500 [Marinitenerispora sediminis]RCV59401.1 hypothetical protein DEF23_07535 [Marinitenerispora sediminis]